MSYPDGDALSDLLWLYGALNTHAMIDNTKKTFTDDFGNQIVNVHSRINCASEYCVIHNQSDHNMRSFKLLWRNDRGMFERICTHGIGHPDPDHLTSKKAMVDGDSIWGEGVHGCDGCCRGSNEGTES